MRVLPSFEDSRTLYDSCASDWFLNGRNAYTLISRVRGWFKGNVNFWG